MILSVDQINGFPKDFEHTLFGETASINSNLQFFTTGGQHVQNFTKWIPKTFQCLFFFYLGILKAPYQTKSRILLWLHEPQIFLAKWNI